MRAARETFEDNGFLGTTVNEITERAGVSHGTFYTYFGSKEHIFSEVVDDLIADFREVEREEPRSGLDPTARIERANRGYLHAYQKNAAMMAILEQVGTLSPELKETRRRARVYWVERTESAIRRWKQEGLVAPDVDPFYAARVLGSMVDRSAYVWFVLGEPVDVDIALEQLTLLYCRALGLKTDA